MGDRRCCCNCWTATDDFFRADSTDLGIDWLECTGDWEILNFELVANEKGIAIWKRAPSGGTPRTGIITIKLIHPADGMHYRIYAFADDCSFDKTQCAYADVLITQSGGTTLATVDVGGPNILSTGAVTNSIGLHNTLTFCVGLSELMAYVSGSTYPSRACHDGTINETGIYFALSNESETEIAVFDDAYQIDHYDHDTRCPSCGCDCEGHCMPLVLCLTVTEDQSCSALDGLTFTLDNSGACTWQSDPFDCPPYFGLYWEMVPIGLWLGETGLCSKFSIVLYSSGGTPLLTLTDSTNCACDPLFIEWTGNVLSGDSYSSHCCEGYIEPCAGSDCTAIIPGPPPQNCWCPGKFTVTVTECPTDPDAMFEDNSDWYWEDGTDRYWEGIWV